jgi:hypothetical protein
VFQLCTNHFVRVLCKPVWVSEACQLFLVPSRSFNPPLYPSKGCELRSVPRLLLPLPFTWTHIWVFQGVGGASFVHHSEAIICFRGNGVFDFTMFSSPFNVDIDCIHRHHWCFPFGFTSSSFIPSYSIFFWVDV